MNISDLMKLLDRPIAFQRPFVDLTGSVTAALFLSQAVYWQRRTTATDGYFYKTREEWEEETGLSRYEQETAKKKLADIGVLRFRQVGTDRTMRFQVDIDRLFSLLIPIGGNPADGTVTSPPMQVVESSRTLPETTTEITAESSLPIIPLTQSSLPELPLAESVRDLPFPDREQSASDTAPIENKLLDRTQPLPGAKALRAAEPVGEPDPEWAAEWHEYLALRRERKWSTRDAWQRKTLAWLRTIADPKASLAYTTLKEYQGIVERGSAKPKRLGLVDQINGYLDARQ